MSLNKFFEKLSDRIAIENLTWILTAGSAVSFVLSWIFPGFLEQIVFIPNLVLAGEFWRIFTFLFYPLSLDPIFAFFTYYLFFLMGRSLEGEWGSGKFTGYVLLSTISTIVASFFYPSYPATNVYIYTSVFLAFAYLYPEFILNIFFIIPVPIKYLAMITWIFFGWTILTETWSERVMAIVPLANFFVFFGRSIFDEMRMRKNQMEHGAQRIRDEGKPFHLCTTCGITEKSNPDMDFRVCLECKGGVEYCMDHLSGHVHMK